MENELDAWDEYIHIYTQSHNKSTNIHGYTPEELQFGFTNPKNGELIQFWPDTKDPQHYITQISQVATNKREKARILAQRERDRGTTYRNQSRRIKEFLKGQIVLHRQLQVSTGTGGSLQPTFTGPYVVEYIEPHKNSAIIEHMHTGRQMHAHFTNMQPFEFDPRLARTPSNLDKLIPSTTAEEKQSQKRYFPDQKEVRESLNLIHKNKLDNINKEYNEKHQKAMESKTITTHTQEQQNRHRMTTRPKQRDSF